MDPSIIGFYGSYAHGQTFNVILEYANEGTLEDYFANVPPPSTSRDIYTFWKGILPVLRGLEQLHDLEYSDNLAQMG
jgi:serine/threonine protein kinase